MIFRPLNSVIDQTNAWLHERVELLNVLAGELKARQELPGEQIRQHLDDACAREARP